MLVFLTSIILLILTRPLLLGSSFYLIYSKVLISLVLFAGLAAICRERKTLVLGFFVAALTSLIGFIDIVFQKFQNLYILHLILTLVIFIFTTIVIINNVLKSEIVDSKMLYAALSAYLLLGVIGSLIFTLLNILDPSAFNVNLNSQNGQQSLYLSFVTLTTLGYGDIVPMTHLAQTICIVLSLIGQVYLTVIIAIIVAKYVMQISK